MEIGSVKMAPTSALDRVAEAAFGSSKTKTGSVADNGSGFASMVRQSLAEVDATQTQAQSMTHRYQLGQNDVSLEDAMISLQKANISFQTTVQVRNKLVTAYNDIMNMQL